MHVALNEEILTAEQLFGRQVKEARLSRGWSQDQLARRLREEYDLDLHQTAIGRMESGTRAIRYNEVSALASLLEIEIRPYHRVRPLSAEEYEIAKVRVEELWADFKAREQERDDLMREFHDADAWRLTLLNSRRQAAQTLREQIQEYEMRTQIAELEGFLEGVPAEKKRLQEQIDGAREALAAREEASGGERHEEA